MQLFYWCYWWGEGGRGSNKFKKQQHHAVNLQLAAGIYPEPSESIRWLEEVTPGMRVWCLRSGVDEIQFFGFKLCWIVNICWRFDVFILCFTLNVEAQCSSATSVAFDSRHRVTFRWRHQMTRVIFRREPAATFLTEVSSSHSIHAVAGELKLLGQDWVRNVDLWYC